MAVVEARILTIGWDSAAGMFDDSVLREYLADRELLRAEPQFFIQGGRPFWSVYLETRTLAGVDVATSPGKSPSQPAGSSSAAFAALLSELDETERARYQRIIDWRREASKREGVPHFVLCTNRQAMDLCRRAPRTLQALQAIKGFGAKRVAKHGKELLEVLHGRMPGSDAGPPDPVRAMDEHDEVDAGTHGAIPETLPALADEPRREHHAGDSGGGDDRGVLEAPDRGTVKGE